MYPHNKETSLSTLPTELHVPILEYVTSSPGTFIALASTNRYWHNLYQKHVARLLPCLIAETFEDSAVLFHLLRVYALLEEHNSRDHDSDASLAGRSGAGTPVTHLYLSQGRDWFVDAIPGTVQGILATDEELLGPSLGIFEKDSDGPISRERDVAWIEVLSWARKMGSERLGRLLCVYNKFRKVGRAIVPGWVWENRGRRGEFPLGTRVGAEGISEPKDGETPGYSSASVQEMYESDRETTPVPNRFLKLWGLSSPSPPIWRSMTPEEREVFKRRNRQQAWQHSFFLCAEIIREIPEDAEFGLYDEFVNLRGPILSPRNHKQFLVRDQFMTRFMPALVRTVLYGKVPWGALDAREALKDFVERYKVQKSIDAINYSGSCNQVDMLIAAELTWRIRDLDDSGLFMTDVQQQDWQENSKKVSEDSMTGLFQFLGKKLPFLRRMDTQARSNGSRPTKQQSNNCINSKAETSQSLFRTWSRSEDGKFWICDGRLRLGRPESQIAEFLGRCMAHQIDELLEIIEGGKSGVNLLKEMVRHAREYGVNLYPFDRENSEKPSTRIRGLKIFS